MTTTFDTSGIVEARPDLGRFGNIVWSDLSPFTQGYIEAMPWETLRPALGWPVTYEGRHFGYMQTATPLEALAKVRSDNPHHAAGRFHVQGVGFYSLAPETLARIIADCEQLATLYGFPTAEHGRMLWEARGETVGASIYAETFHAMFPPLTVQLGDDGKIRFSERD